MCTSGCSANFASTGPSAHQAQNYAGRRNPSDNPLWKKELLYEPVCMCLRGEGSTWTKNKNDLDFGFQDRKKQWPLTSLTSRANLGKPPLPLFFSIAEQLPLGPGGLPRCKRCRKTTEGWKESVTQGLEQGCQVTDYGLRSGYNSQRTGTQTPGPEWLRGLRNRVLRRGRAKLGGPGGSR